ncbi:FtsW/RodA/SpoVE family cell cycle protein [Phycisphaerales bacterium AB-hyl4]|uniref:Probable peptidoglycan glycosyltransferase FtsW n=1 Tax=Natronomicrosphaera hydrolytica TaxID=3242702 RepID=A0ABV4U2W0_9BACT
MDWVLEQLRLMLRPHAGWYGFIAALGLTLFGVLAIDTVQPHYAVSQAQRWLPIALLAMAVCMIPRPRFIGEHSYILAAIAIVFMLVLIVPGLPRSIVPVINGARRWIDFQFLLFQPSELAKIAFVLALAWYLRYRNNYRTFRGLLIPFVITMMPVALLLKQPDLGTAMVFVPTLCVMMVAAGAKLRHLSSLIAIGLVLVGVNVAIVAFDAPQSMRLLKPHQEARIAAMLWPERHRDREGYQQQVAITIVGSGGVRGVGGEQSATLLRFNHLPENHNDMIFAIIVNRWGLIGGVAVMGLYIVLVSSFFLVAARSKDPFARLVCVGFGGMMFIQAAINIGVTVGLLPITGITLPFVSYGGSSLVAAFVMVGLMLNFASRRPQIMARPSFEFDRAEAAAE